MVENEMTYDNRNDWNIKSEYLELKDSQQISPFSNDKYMGLSKSFLNVDNLPIKSLNYEVSQVPSFKSNFENINCLNKNYSFGVFEH